MLPLVPIVLALGVLLEFGVIRSYQLYEHPGCSEGAPGETRGYIIQNFDVVVAPICSMSACEVQCRYYPTCVTYSYRLPVPEDASASECYMHLGHLSTLLNNDQTQPPQYYCSGTVVDGCYDLGKGKRITPNGVADRIDFSAASAISECAGRCADHSECVAYNFYVSEGEWMCEMLKKKGDHMDGPFSYDGLCDRGCSALEEGSRWFYGIDDPLPTYVETAQDCSFWCMQNKDCKAFFSWVNPTSNKLSCYTLKSDKPKTPSDLTWMPQTGTCSIVKP